MGHTVVMTYVPEGFVKPPILDEAGVALEPRPCGLQDEDQIIEAGRNADALVVPGVQRCSQRVVERLERCRVISVVGVGYDAIDVAAATERGICVTNTPRYCIHEVPEHALAFVFALGRKIIPLDRAVKTGKWTRIGAVEIQTDILGPVRRLTGLTLGIVGFGNIGRTLAQKAKAVGFRVVAHDPLADPAAAAELGVPLLPLDELLRASDFVSLHAALTSGNRGMIGAAELRQMKPTAYLLNLGRGGLVDQDALVSALSERTIAGAALDVMEPEPLPLDSPLLALDNVILTPHAAYFSQESGRELWREPFVEAVRVLKGEWPSALVNPGVKEAFVRRWGPMR